MQCNNQQMKDQSRHSAAESYNLQKKTYYRNCLSTKRMLSTLCILKYFKMLTSSFTINVQFTLTRIICANVRAVDLARVFTLCERECSHE